VLVEITLTQKNGPVRLNDACAASLEAATIWQDVTHEESQHVGFMMDVAINNHHFSVRSTIYFD
jgi:hypothetical protein